MGRRRRSTSIPSLSGVDNMPVTMDSAKGDRTMDVLSRLLKDRIVFLWDDIDHDAAVSVVSQLLLLSSEDEDSPISLYIMTSGGEISAALAIYDTMQMIPCPVATYCLGEASSAGAFLLSAGHPGRRYALPNCRIMMHQPMGEAEGDSTDIQIQAEEISRLREILFSLMASHTGRTVQRIAKDFERDRWMGATEAKKYGLIDKVLLARKSSTIKSKKKKPRGSK